MTATISTKDWQDEGGLLPASDGVELSLRRLLHYWFVQYNPLYFFSALCVLAGIYLLAEELDAPSNSFIQHGQAWLFGVIQFYEALLLLGAAILAKQAQVLRPAVMLILLECLFLFDPTFRLENISLLGNEGLALLAIWFVAVAIKLWAIGYVLPLHIPRLINSLALLAAASLAAALAWHAQPQCDHTLVLLISNWLGGILLAVLLVVQPQVTWTAPASPQELELIQPKLHLLLRGVLYLLAGFYFYHWLNYVFWVASDPRLALVFGSVLLLLVALVRTKESEIWTAVVAAVILAINLPIAQVSVLFMAAVVLAWRAWQTKRFATGAVVAGYLGIWQLSQLGLNLPFTLNPILIHAILAAGLLIVGWRLREPSAWLLLLVAVVWYGYEFPFWHYLTLTRFGLGILLLITGFGALVGGIAINWWLREPQANTRAIL